MQRSRIKSDYYTMICTFNDCVSPSLLSRQHVVMRLGHAGPSCLTGVSSGKGCEERRNERMSVYAVVDKRRATNNKHDGEGIGKTARGTDGEMVWSKDVLDGRESAQCWVGTGLAQHQSPAHDQSTPKRMQSNFGKEVVLDVIGFSVRYRIRGPRFAIRTMPNTTSHGVWHMLQKAKIRHGDALAS